MYNIINKQHNSAWGTPSARRHEMSSSYFWIFLTWVHLTPSTQNISFPNYRTGRSCRFCDSKIDSGSIPHLNTHFSISVRVVPAELMTNTVLFLIFTTLLLRKLVIAAHRCGHQQENESKNNTHIIMVQYYELFDKWHNEYNNVHGGLLPH